MRGRKHESAVSPQGRGRSTAAFVLTFNVFALNRSSDPDNP